MTKHSLLAGAALAIFSFGGMAQAAPAMAAGAAVQSPATAMPYDARRGVFTFAAGLEESLPAVVQVTTSFDIAGHRHSPIEIYGSEGTLSVPDPNRFEGPVEFLKTGGAWEDRPVAQPYADGNYRSLGVADMAHALRSGRPHRASGALALHVLEVMEAFQVAADSRRSVEITTDVARPEPLAASIIDGQLAR